MVYEIESKAYRLDSKCRQDVRKVTATFQLCATDLCLDPIESVAAVSKTVAGGMRLCVEISTLALFGTDVAISTVCDTVEP